MTIQQVARLSYGRLIAFLSSRTNDLSSAEDALADAFLVALTKWPEDGVPNNPEAWLLTTARRKLLDRHRHSNIVDASFDKLVFVQQEAESSIAKNSILPDERLGLLCACAHPAIEPAIRTPLMLQVVLGLDAKQIASAFLLSPSAMTKRLTRAKIRIREASIPFIVPEDQEFHTRLLEVLDAIYATFTFGRSTSVDYADAGSQLAEEAIWLAQVVVSLVPDNPEVLGLLSLMLFSYARKHTQKNKMDYVPLSDQDASLWSESLIKEAEYLLKKASHLGCLGRYQIEAAIQSVHADRKITGYTDWEAIISLYQGLLHFVPVIGARIAYAAALCEIGHVTEALAELDQINSQKIFTYQPYWATRAKTLRLLGHSADAVFAYTRAIGLCEDIATRTYLIAKRKELQS